VRLQPVLLGGERLGDMVALVRTADRLDERAEVLLAHAAREVARGLRRLHDIGWMSSAELTLARLVAHTPGGVLGVSADGTLTAVNEAAVRQLGGSEAALVGASLEELVHPADAARLRALREGRSGQGPLVEGVRFRRRGGGEVVADVRALGRPSSPADADVLLLRFEPEQPAPAAEQGAAQLNRRLLDAAPFGVVLFDGEQRITLVNEAMLQIAGVPDERRAGLVGTRLRDLRLRRAHDWAPLAPLLAEGRPVVHTFEDVHLPYRDTPRTLVVRGVPMGGGERAPEGGLLIIEDLTERRDAERRYRQIAESLPGIVYQFVRHPDGRYEVPWVNRRVEAVMGTPQESYVQDGFRIFRQTHPDDLPGLLASVEASAKDLTPWEGEFRTTGGDGRQVWLSGSAGVQRLEDGSTLWHGMLLDITERRAAEEALRESERRFRSMFESAAVGMALSEASGRILDANPTLARMLGYDRHELIGRFSREITHPGDRSIESGLFREMIESRQGFLHLEKRYLRKDGSYLWGRLSLSASLDEEGRPAFLISMVEDVTERVALVEELTRARESLENLLDHLAVGVGIVQRGRFVYVNPALCRVLGHDARALRALEPVALIEQGARSRLWELIARLDKGLVGEIHAVECLRRRADDVFEARVTGVSIRHRDRPADLFVVEDVGVERALQARMAQAQKLHTIGTLAGGIAHDVNNLLTGLASHAGLLRERLGGDAEGEAAIDGIERLVDRAAALTRKLLAFGRRQILHPVPVDVNELIEGFLPMARRLLGERILIVERLAPGLPAVRADALQIEQVLLNLAVNARDAMPGGGRLDIETEARVVPGGVGVPDEVVVRVRDTGPGIPAELLPRLFEPFVTTKPVGEGTGLGLAVAHGIVEQHGGSLSARNLPEGGCELCFVLPGSAEPAQRLPERARAGSASLCGGDETVLVAEDDDDLRFLIEHLLRRAGYQVAVATDGRQAVEVFRRHSESVRLVVLDMIMPDRTGLEALAEIRALAPDLPALLISGYSEELAEESARGVALPAFLAKPFRPEELLAAVRRLLSEAGARA